MNTLDKQYTDLIQDILNNGVKKQTRNGEVLSVFGRQIRHRMSEGFPLLTTKKMAFKSIVTELLWFLRGDTNIKYLVDNDCHIWDGDAWANYQRKVLDKFMSDTTIANYAITNKEKFINKIKTDDKFAKVWGDLGKIYGFQWRKWNGEIDQISELIKLIKENPDSRRLMVSAWNVGELDKMTLPPCHYGFQVYTRELSARERTSIGSKGSTRLYDSIKEANYETIDADIEMHKVCDEANVPRRAISLMWNQRSVDTPLGLPFNIASYGLLLEIIAKEVKMVPEELIGNLGDAHIYLNQVDGVKEQIGRTPYELPKINFNTEWWDEPFFKAVYSESFCKCLLEEDIQLYKYQSHPAIKIPLSN